MFRVIRWKLIFCNNSGCSETKKKKKNSHTVIIMYDYIQLNVCAIRPYTLSLDRDL